MIPAAAVDISKGSQIISMSSVVTIATPQCTYELNRSDFAQKGQLYDIYDNIYYRLLQVDCMHLEYFIVIQLHENKTVSSLGSVHLREDRHRLRRSILSFVSMHVILTRSKDSVIYIHKKVSVFCSALTIEVLIFVVCQFGCIRI